MNSAGYFLSEFLRLFRIADFLDIFVSEAWHCATEVWNLHFRCNLTDSEIQKWPSLTTILASVCFHMVPDSWRWTIDPSSSFSIKSLIDDLTGSIDFSARDLYSAIWFDHYSRRIKIFFWELSHSAINTADRLQRRMAYVSFSGLLCYVS